jgi:hypothetical protein
MSGTEVVLKKHLLNELTDAAVIFSAQETIFQI